jgi:hypothetical protein
MSTQPFKFQDALAVLPADLVADAVTDDGRTDHDDDHQ